MTHQPAGCYLDDDGGSVVIAVEAGEEHRQSLEVRVGPVFDGNEQRDEPGVWISYQESHLKTLPAGPVLLTPVVWRQLAAAVASLLATAEC